MKGRLAFFVLAGLILVAPAASGARRHLGMAGTLSGGMGPAWSFDGRQIAYLGPLNSHSRYPSAVIVMRRNGSQKRTILSVGRKPLGEVRFDRGKLIYSIEDSGILHSFDVVTRKASFLGTVDLPANPEEPFTVSRSSGAIAFESQCDCAYPASVIRIIVRPGSTHARALARPTNASDEQPSFSPDGKGIVFARSLYTRPDRSAEGLPKLVVASVSGGSERSLGVEGDLPAWSPDGKWIAFATPNASSQRALAVVPASGGTPRVLLGKVTSLDSFSWAPNSKTLVYETRFGLGTVSLQGSIRAFRTPGVRPGYSTPQWSPDGTTIAFWGIFGRQGYDAGIYTIGLDGRGLRRIA